MSPESPVSLTNGHHSPTNGVVVVNGFAQPAEKTVNENYAPAADRIKRKAKRLTKYLTKDVVNGTPALSTSRLLKNSRKPRNGFGRGLPKKGGAGGKGTWGAYGSELTGDSALDYKDPNYDSESLENGDIHLKAIIPEMTEDEMQKQVEGIILEYFEHGDVHEVMAALDEMRLGERKNKVIVIAVEAAMDHKPSHREMTSVLISDLSEEIVTSEDIAKAFEILLGNLPDLILDAPDAPIILGNFIARAVADDCFATVNVVHSWKDMVTNEHAKSAMAHAEVLLKDKIGMLRLNNVWGVGGGAQPVKALSRRIYMLLEEFLSSQDATEAARCLRELEVPHFHHELVYEAIVMAIESMQENIEESICRLLKSLFTSCLLTPDQMKRGFFRVFEDLPDICIDVPAAYALADRLVTRAQRHGFIGDDVVRQVPTRGRKRFVSEGDGGKVKEDILD
ncbi:unnamed protein product [Allacma fusca]|uniref:Programmed cell death protein 4 n=1 Tax=Allacma fusca TaxID=39272 RepID=A0A8J2LHM7_9HEXA|nr:unnamed protein product [Allacma fusca]